MLSSRPKAPKMKECLQQYNNKKISRMKKKQIKHRIQQSKILSTQPQFKLFFVDDDYLHKSLLCNKIVFPQMISSKYDVIFQPKNITFKINANGFYDNADISSISAYFKNLFAYHLRAEEFTCSDADVKFQIDNGRVNQIIAYKKFYIDQGRFEKGDYLLYSRVHVKEFVNMIKSFIKNQSLLFELDTLFQQRNIPFKYSQTVTQIVTDNYKPQIIKQGQQLGIIVSDIKSRSEKRIDKEKKPMNSINLIVSGNGLNIHELFLKIQSIIMSVPIICAEIEEESMPQSEQISQANDIFQEYGKKIFKIAPHAVLILDHTLDQVEIAQIKRKLKMKKWEIGQQQNFLVQQIRILELEHRKNSLRHHMSSRRITWQKIEFGLGQIYLTCDQATKNAFIKQCRNILKQFIKEKQLCQNFDSVFLVEVFKKYYKKSLQAKHSVKFQFGEDYVIRHNYNKYSQEIQEELKCIKDKIKKKLVTFVTRKSIKTIQNINYKFFSEEHNPSGYEHHLIGSSLYQMGNVRIKMKKLQGLKKQEECLIYILDDRLKDQSIFHQILKTNKLNFQSFLQDAHRTKKPDRLRQYITDQCPRARKTILLHSGPERVTNTLKKDVQILFSNLENRICAALLMHEDNFLFDVFKPIITYIRDQSINYVGRDSNNSISSVRPLQCEVDFYYEGGPAELKQIEEVLKSRDLQVRKISAFCLQQLDIQKIYSLEYCSMIAHIQEKPTKVSPIIAQLTYQQIKKTRAGSTKKFAFSLYQQNCKQLVQFIINTKSKIYHKVTHDQGVPCSRPHIQQIDQLQPQLLGIVLIISKYFCLDYIVISADSVSDGIHGRVMKYYKQIYYAKMQQNNIIPVTLDFKHDKMLQSIDRDPFKYQLKLNNITSLYQVTTFLEEYNLVSPQLSF